MTTRVLAILVVCIAQQVYGSQVTLLEGQIDEGGLYLQDAGGNYRVFQDFPAPYVAEFYYQPDIARATFRFTLVDEGPRATQTIQDNLIPGVLQNDNMKLEVAYDFSSGPTITRFDLELDKATGAGEWNWFDLCLVCDRVIDPYSKATNAAFREVQAGDFEQDGDVDAADLAAWSQNVGLVGIATHRQGDADGDADVDGDDFLVWQRQVGGAGPALGAVPEAGAGVLAWLAVGGGALVRRRRW
jgi:hypothetical protein